MGFLTNIFAAALVNRHNHSRNNIISHSIDFLPLDGNLIICGGRNGQLVNKSYRLTCAEDIKLKAFYLSVQRSAANKRGTVCMYSAERFPYPDISKSGVSLEKIIHFGENASYMPLDSDDIGREGTLYFFQRVISSYSKRTNADSFIISSVVQMLISVLANLGDRFITFQNLRKIAEPMYISQINFEQTVGKLTGVAFQLGNFLTLRWDDVVRHFLPFWDEFCQALPKVQGKPSASLYTGVSDKKICLCRVPSGNYMLKEIFMSELVLLNEKVPHYNFIDYYVSLESIKEYNCLSNKTVYLIGDTFSTMGISKMFISNPIVLCMGVSAKDASEICEKMVAISSWTKITLGLGHGGHVDFTGSDRKPIEEDMLTLTRIPDGSACRLDDRGVTFIRNLF